MINQQEDPLVSIALCTYNGDFFLSELLDSLVAQSYKNLEIIVVDDASSDQTVQIIMSYASKYNFVKLYQNDANLGFVKNFEKTIRLCNGEFIALADQDDIWKLDKISLMVDKIDNHCLLYHDSELISEEGKLINQKISDIVRFYDGDAAEAFLFFNCVSSHALMFKKELTQYLFPFCTNGIHDSWIAYVAVNIGSISYINDCLVLYRQHQCSSTDILKRKKKRETNRLEIFNAKLEWLNCCKDFAYNKNPLLIKEIFVLFKLRKTNIFSFKLFFLLISNYKNIFPIYKKSFLSKLNFIIKNAVSV